MDDIVERLRQNSYGHGPGSMVHDAADEIDRLRRALDAARVDNEQYEQANEFLNGVINDLRRELAAYKDAATARDRNEDELRRELADARWECEEQARLVGMGSEREARLIAELAEARKLLRRVVDHDFDLNGGYPVIDEIDAFLTPAAPAPGPR